MEGSQTGDREKERNLYLVAVGTTRMWDARLEGTSEREKKLAWVGLGKGGMFGAREKRIRSKGSIFEKRATNVAGVGRKGDRGTVEKSFGTKVGG